MLELQVPLVSQMLPVQLFLLLRGVLLLVLMLVDVLLCWLMRSCSVRGRVREVSTVCHRKRTRRSSSGRLCGARMGCRGVLPCCKRQVWRRLWLSGRHQRRRR